MQRRGLQQMASTARTKTPWVWCALCAVPLLAAPLGASDWPSWRGIAGNGAATESGLVDSWSPPTAASPAGVGLAWRRDFEGRSTPVVHDGRVCAAGRVGKDISRQEIVACWDAASGAPLWERRFNVYLTAVPFNRVGWANPVYDPETGYLYHHGVGGLLVCLDPKDGHTVWQRELTEEVGHLSGYGGRTQTPLVFEDMLLLSFVSAGWGDQAAPRHRFFAFDKRTGTTIYVAMPGTAMPFDMNTQGGQVIAQIGGQTLLIGGNSDGIVYAVQARTGKKVWEFKLSGNALNTTPVVDGTTVYISHSEENVDEGTQGRLVAIDATGTGDVTKTHELWRLNELGAGFASPLVHDGRVYVVDNSANLVAVDQKTGKELWQFDLGTVGKGSPQWADGKVWATEVNGHFHILRPTAEGAVPLDQDLISMPNGHYAELYGSAAFADGRVFFTSEEGIYALGKAGPPSAGRSPQAKPAPPLLLGTGPVAQLIVTPAEVLLAPGETATFAVRAYDANGNPVAAGAATWTTSLVGTLAAGVFTADAASRLQAGSVTAKLGEVVGTARVRVVPPLPWKLDFTALEDGKAPPTWIGATGKFAVATRDGEKVLTKAPLARGLQRSEVYMGPATWSGYTVQADLMGLHDGARLPDICLINGGYTFELMGAHQKIELRDWASMLRLAREAPFAWQAGSWYRVKFRVEPGADKTALRIKIWPREASEPADWMLQAEDPVPIRQGSPGICGYSPSTIVYDNLEVTPNS